MFGGELRLCGRDGLGEGFQVSTKELKSRWCFRRPNSSLTMVSVYAVLNGAPFPQQLIERSDFFHPAPFCPERPASASVAACIFSHYMKGEAKCSSLRLAAMS